MAKKYIRLNNDDNHLSLGNFFRIIKDVSINKTAALQSELFCIIFSVNDINDTTVNNYCVGIRGIGNEYKQTFINKEKKYQNNKEEFCDIIINIINIIDGRIYTVDKNKINFINSNDNIKYLCHKLYNLAKNDKEITLDTINKYSSLIENNKYYTFLVEVLLFIILTKRQPIYEEDLKKEVLESFLNDTSISAASLQEYLSLKIREGINYDYSLKKIADEGNAYANYELGTNEFYGYIKGYPRYDKALIYLEKAASMNHAGANYFIGRIFIEGLIGNKENSEMENGYNYLEKAYSLGNIAAANTMGYMYYKGIYPCKKNINKAKDLFNKAADANYAYAFNNLGKIEENNGNKTKAIEYYLKSANLGESWACNKIGQYYRETNNVEEAYNYYTMALESNHRTICYNAYYNIAKYYLLYGNEFIPKNRQKAYEYLTIASEHNVLKASIELFLNKIQDYKKEKQQTTYEEIINLKSKIEDHPEYNINISNNINKVLKEIKSNKEIDINWL